MSCICICDGCGCKRRLTLNLIILICSLLAVLFTSLQMGLKNIIKDKQVLEIITCVLNSLLAVVETLQLYLERKTVKKESKKNSPDITLEVTEVPPNKK